MTTSTLHKYFVFATLLFCAGTSTAQTVPEECFPDFVPLVKPAPSPAARVSARKGKEAVINSTRVIRSGESVTVYANCPVGYGLIDYVGFLNTGDVAPIQTFIAAGRPSGAYTIDVNATAAPAVKGTLNFQYLSAGVLSIVSGDNQTVKLGTPAQPLIVSVQEEGILAGEKVYWTTYDSTSGPAGFQTLGTSLTDANGVASLPFNLPNRNTGRVVTATIGTQNGAFTGGISSVNFSVTAAAGLSAQQVQQIATQQTAANLLTTQIGVQTQLDNINKRIRYLRFQGRTPGFRHDIDIAVNGRGVPLPGGGCGSVSNTGASNTNEECEDKTQRATASGWGSYVIGGVDVTDKTDGGLSVNTKGLTVGADNRVSKAAAVGAAIGALKSSSDMGVEAGKQTATGYSMVAYGAFAPSPKTFVDFAATWGRNTYDLTRQELSGGSATANTKATGIGLSLTGGYDYREGAFIVTPYGRLEYLQSKVDAYREYGESPIAVSDQSLTSTTLALGGEMQYFISTTWGVLIPHARMEYLRQTQTSGKTGTAQLVGDTVQVNIDPQLNLDKDYGTAGVGVSAQFSKGVVGFVDYDRSFGKLNFKHQKYSLGLKVEF